MKSILMKCHCNIHSSVCAIMLMSMRESVSDVICMCVREESEAIFEHEKCMFI